MTVSNRSTIAAFFQTNDIPTQAQFSDLFDSVIFQTGTSAQTIKSDVSASGKFEIYNDFSIKSSAQTNLSGNAIVSGAVSVVGHTTFEGVTSTGATGTGKLVYDGTPTLVTPVLGVATGATLGLSGKIPTYNNVTTAGWGVPAVYASAVTDNTGAAVASVATYTLGAADGAFIISANVNVFAGASASFTVTVAYTDEKNTSRTTTMNFSNQAGTIATALTQATGAYQGIPLHIRCKASTSITIATTGTFTSVAYNVQGSIIQIQ